jgi:hypothetical protein
MSVTKKIIGESAKGIASKVTRIATTQLNIPTSIQRETHTRNLAPLIHSGQKTRNTFQTNEILVRCLSTNTKPLSPLKQVQQTKKVADKIQPLVADLVAIGNGLGDLNPSSAAKIQSLLFPLLTNDDSLRNPTKLEKIVLVVEDLMRDNDIKRCTCIASVLGGSLAKAAEERGRGGFDDIGYYMTFPNKAYLQFGPQHKKETQDTINEAKQNLAAIINATSKVKTI